MMKVQLVYLTLCSLSQSAYISRMATVNRLRVPTAFRPGVSMQRPWMHQRLVQAASHRAPYVLYRNPPHRYAIKHYGPSATRNMYTGGPWKSTARVPPPAAVTPDYEFIRAASAQPVVHTNGDAGAIHTIPAPNLSLSEKPIVVLESTDSENNVHASAASEPPKPTYEVTEKYQDVPIYQMAKIETPVSFSKINHLTSPELQALVRNGAALQYASEYGLSAIALPQNPVAPQQFAVESIHSLPTREDIFNPAAEGIVIPPNALYQPDPMFLQKLQSQLLQRYPSVEFIPYDAEVPQIQIQSQPQSAQPQQLFLLENEQIKQSPSAFVPNDAKNIVQRATQESSIVTLIPQTMINNITEAIEVTSPPQPNITYQIVAAEPQPVTTTIKYVIESNTEQENTTPIYYAQVGQSVGNVIANGFYSAINDVRAAAALEQVESPQETTQAQITILEPNKDNFTSTTIHPNLQGYFMQNPEKNEKNQTITELKPILGVPFAKKTDSVNVAYTLRRVDEKDPKVNQEGAVYAGQIVEATISEDQEFNNEKASFLSRRPPIRLFAVSENKDLTAAASSSVPKIAVVKAKIPPKSKLTYDDKTGEPVLRIYASYVDSPKQREIVTTKLANMQHLKEPVTRKETTENWKSATVKSVDKTQGFDANQVTKFGLKLKSRSDDYIPLFEEYDE